MFKRFIKNFTMTNNKRRILLALTVLLSILITILSAVGIIVPKSKLGIAYAGGYEYLVQIEVGDGKDTEESNRLASEIASEIYERINPLGTSDVSAEPELNKNGNAFVRVEIADVSDSEREDYERLITNKPKLTMTDIAGNPLFRKDGSYNKGIAGSTTFEAGNDINLFNFARNSKVPIKSSGASFRRNPDLGGYEVVVDLEDGAAIGSWWEATTAFAELAQPIVMWVDLDDYISKASNGEFDYDNENKYVGNPYEFAHVESNPENKLKKHQFDASKYLISSATVSEPILSPSFVISGNFTLEQVKNLSRMINYGVSDYSLRVVSSNYTSSQYGSNAFKYTVIAGAIVFFLIAAILIYNYGILGLISTISIALFFSSTIAIFIIVGGVFTPEAIAAIIIGIGMSVDANIITFERLKSEYYQGTRLEKANRRANKKSLSTIMDSNLTTAIVAFVLFFFGTRSIIGLSVTLIISIFFTLVIMLLLTRFMTLLLINSGVYNNKPHLFGLRKEKDLKTQDIINKYDYIKLAKKANWISYIIIGAGVLVMSIMSIMSMNFGATFNLSQDFKGGTNVSITAKDSSISDADKNKILQELADAGFGTSDINEIYEGNNLVSITANTTSDIDVAELSDSLKSITSADPTISNTTNDVAKQLVKDALLAITIAFALIVAYTLIRFRWTFSFAAIIALVHDGLIITAVFILTRVTVNPVFIAGLLSVIGYSINDTIVTFDRIRERLNSVPGEVDEKAIKDVANNAIKDTLKRSLLTTFTTLSAIIVLMAFGSATSWTFNIAMLIGMISGTYSSIFIASSVWVKLENYRIRRQRRRIKNKFWAVATVEEQTFSGINDFNY